MEYRFALAYKFHGTYVDNNAKAYVIYNSKDELIAEDLTRAEAEKEILSLNDIVPASGKCFIMSVGTGCTCCNYEDFKVGPFLHRKNAEASAKWHHDRKVLSSQYAENGTQHISEHDYEISGRFFVIDEQHAIPMPEDDLASFKKGELSREDLDASIGSNHLDNMK